MSSESSRVRTIAQLRAAARVHGVEPADVDLEAVQSLLAGILAALVEIEDRHGPELPPAALFLPDEWPS
jgi:hypothetical protein